MSLQLVLRPPFHQLQRQGRVVTRMINGGANQREYPNIAQTMTCMDSAGMALVTYTYRDNLSVSSNWIKRHLLHFRANLSASGINTVRPIRLSVYRRVAIPAPSPFLESQLQVQF
ncbi:hypothetical protein ACRALDRAFT_2019278 [Sodiomyces alcalophilus JCM 7366]|uniref:uncharacterized protein n=1 Tax=Sodiomyces alcalophilus JCM 7366 TaxID=591952 RepID=UPI0039B4CC6E